MLLNSPSDDKLIGEIHKLFALETIERPEIIDQKWQELLSQPHSKNRANTLYSFYNEFRIRFAPKLPKTRPQILIGGPFEVKYPNNHTFPLLRVADVVIIACSSKPLNQASALNCHPYDHFLEVLKKLPKGFHPDFYWDNQVEYNHFVPNGIELAPFPIFASLCHSFHHKSIEHICELFDFVLPLSSLHAKILRKKYPEKVIEHPFGMNWAAFEEIPPVWDKEIDLFVSFPVDDSPAYGNRRKIVLELMDKFKSKYGNRFSIVISPPIPRDKYVDFLQKSRIVVNVTGVHGPYNYRTMEAMAAGSMVFQYDWDDDFFENKFSEYFIDGTHGVGFNESNYESKLLYYLENPEISSKIAREGHHFVNEKYNYKDLYQSMIERIKSTSVNLPRHQQNYRGFHHVGMIYYNQNNHLFNMINYAPIAAQREESWIKYNNLMVLSGDLSDVSLGYHNLVMLMEEPIDIQDLPLSFYTRALDCCPASHAWIVKWNYLLLKIQKGQKVQASDMDNLITLLKQLDPDPFDEQRIIFKYFINSPKYPQYQLTDPKKCVNKFTELNINLLKVIDQPKERANLHKMYALDLMEIVAKL